MNGSWNEKLFHIEMATRTGDTALNQLNHIIDVDVEKFESFNRYTTLQSVYTALAHQLQDRLMNQHEFHRTRYVRTLWD